MDKVDIALLACVSAVVVIALYGVSNSGKRREEFHRVCREHLRGTPVHDGRQWVCLRAGDERPPRVERPRVLL